MSGMNLYRIEYGDAGYDEQSLYLVLAGSPDEARVLAHTHALGRAKPYSERSKEDRMDLIGDADPSVWLDPEASTLDEVPMSAGVVAGHWHAG
jgi:hypothetical protein